MHTPDVASVTVFDLAEIEKRQGRTVVRISGKNARSLFSGEAGGHRFQHVPKHDKKGRTHTSTVTVAILDEEQVVSIEIPEEDIEIMTCRSSGKGGQHVNKTDSAIQIRYLPTGLIVRCESERSQFQNKMNAMAQLKLVLLKERQSIVSNERSQERRQQLGSGQRGDKRRSYYFQRDVVTDHVSGKEWRLKSFLRGEWD